MKNSNNKSECIVFSLGSYWTPDVYLSLFHNMILSWGLIRTIPPSPIEGHKVSSRHKDFSSLPLDSIKYIFLLLIHATWNSTNLFNDEKHSVLDRTPANERLKQSGQFYETLVHFVNKTFCFKSCLVG